MGKKETCTVKVAGDPFSKSIRGFKVSSRKLQSSPTRRGFQPLNLLAHMPPLDLVRCYHHLLQRPPSTRNRQVHPTSYPHHGSHIPCQMEPHLPAARQSEPSPVSLHMTHASYGRSRTTLPREHNHHTPLQIASTAAHDQGATQPESATRTVGADKP